VILDYILIKVVQNILPKAILAQVNNQEDFDVVISYVKKSISISPLYVRFPEKFLRLCLFGYIAVFRLVELTTLGKIKLSASIRFLSRLHPLFDDGIRLYLFLAMFAIFENDSFRVDKGFPEYADLLKFSITNFSDKY